MSKPEIGLGSEILLPFWCSGNITDLANRLLPLSSDQSGAAKRRRALVQGILTKNTCGSSNLLQNWSLDRVNRAVTYYRKVRLREYVRTELPDFTNSLIVISFGVHVMVAFNFPKTFDSGFYRTQAYMKKISIMTMLVLSATHSLK